MIVLSSRQRIVFACLSGVLTAANLSFADSKAKKSAPLSEPIKIGEVGSMTGSQATFGISTHQGIELAMKEINAAGGIHGRKLELKSLDDQGKPEEAATAVTRLINQDKVIAILGEVASSRSLAMAPIAQKNKIPMISPSSTNEKVTEVGDYIFRVCFVDGFQGTVMAKFASDSLKAKNVAILRDAKSDYSKGLSESFKDAFTKLGGTIVIDQAYSEGDQDFKSQLTKIKAFTSKGKDEKGVEMTKRIDAIYVPGYYTEVGLIARQARELGIKAPLLGGDGWDSSKLVEIGQGAVNGSFYSNHYSDEDKNPKVVAFIEKFKRDYKAVPDGLAAMGYDAMNLLADAMRRTKNVTSEEIKTEINKTAGFEAVTGKITFDKNRNPVKSAVVIEIVKGVHKYKTTVNP